MKKLLFIEVSILSIVLYLGLFAMSAANAADASYSQRIISIDGSITEIIYALENTGPDDSIFLSILIPIIISCIIGLLYNHQ